MPVGDVLPEIAVLIAAVLGVLLASFLPQRRQRLCATLALVGIGIATTLCALQLLQAARASRKHSDVAQTRSDCRSRLIW